MKILLLSLQLLTLKNFSPKEFDIYTQEFFELFPLVKQEVSFKFFNKYPDFVLDPYTNQIRDPHGYCDLEDKSIHINQDWWKRETSIFRKRKVIFHELGHCLLGLDHPKNKASFTIMNSILETADKDGLNWNYLKKELKRRAYVNSSK